MIKMFYREKWKQGAREEKMKKEKSKWRRKMVQKEENKKKTLGFLSIFQNIEKKTTSLLCTYRFIAF